MSIFQEAFVDELQKLAGGELTSWPAVAKQRFAEVSRATPAKDRRWHRLGLMNAVAREHNQSFNHGANIRPGFSTTSKAPFVDRILNTILFPSSVSLTIPPKRTT